MAHLSFLHDHVMMIMVMVLFFIFYMFVYLFFSTYSYKFFLESVLVETIWSIVPSFLLIILVFPSMKVLYLMEDLKTSAFTFKIIGHQWYWTYVVPLYRNYVFEAFGGWHHFSYEYESVLDTSSLYPRLLGCNTDLVIPVNYVSRFLVTSTDVIHSFAVPSLALKVDAVPGRINQIFSFPTRCGMFFGQCSEICGTNHSFMPISLKVMTEDSYEKRNLSVLLVEAFGCSEEGTDCVAYF